MSGQTSLSRPKPAQTTLLLASLLLMMGGAMVAPALPAIEHEFANAPNASVLVGLIITMHGLFVAISSPVIGSIADRVGRRSVLLISTVVYALAGGSGFVLDSLLAILTGRAVLGIAIAGIMVTVTALITEYYEDNKRETVLGRQGAFMSFGGTILLPVADILANIGWRIPSLIYLASLVLLPAIIYFLPEPEQQESTGDRPTSLAELRWTVRQLPVRSLALSLGCFSVGYAMIGLGETFLLLIVGLIIGGAGNGFLLPTLNTWLASVTSETVRGRALGVDRDVSWTVRLSGRYAPAQ